MGLYVKEEPETFPFSPLEKMDLFTLLIYNELYFKLLPENGCHYKSENAHTAHTDQLRGVDSVST